MTHNHDDSVSVALTALERAAEELRSEISEVEPEDAPSACGRIIALRQLLADCLDLAELQAEDSWLSGFGSHKRSLDDPNSGA